jgi:hypothetical protein
MLSSLSMLLDAKSLQASVGSGLLAGLFGGTVVGATTAPVVEVGKIAIHVAEKRHEMKIWQGSYHLAYIFDIRRFLS